MTFSNNELVALKAYVSSQLSKFTDSADVVTLTDYVLALLKYEKPVAELRELCLTELSDFLSEHTEPFVNDLMNAIESKSYLSGGTQGEDVAMGDSTGHTSSQPATNTDSGVGQSNESSVNSSETRNQNFSPFNFIPNFPFPPPMGDMPLMPQGYGQNPQFYDPTQQAPASSEDFGNDNNSSPHNTQDHIWLNGRLVPAPSKTGMLRITKHQERERRGGGRGRGDRRGGAGGPMRTDRRQHINAVRGMVTKEARPGSKILVVDGVPAEKFNEESIREYFQQFGPLKSVTLKRDPDLALLEYESHSSAQKAHANPEPIFNNRFVKVFWKKFEENDSVDVNALAQQQIEKQKAFEEKEAMRKEKQASLQVLYEKKAAMLKAMAEKQAADGKEPTEQLKAMLSALQAEADALGINNAQGEGQTSYNSAYSSAPYRGGHNSYRGRGGYFPRGRGGYRGGARGGAGFVNLATSRYSLDLRPRSVLVSGVTPDKREAFSQYLVNVADLDSADPSSEKPSSFLLTFKDRKSAEQFYGAQKEIPEVGVVEKEWRNTPRTTDSSSNNDTNDGQMDVSQ